MRQLKYSNRIALLSITGATAALLLGGCGGVSTSNNSLAPTPAEQPAIYGLEPTGVVSGQAANLQETSGLESQDGKTAYLTGATASTVTKPIPNLLVNGTIPLGFAPAGAFVGGSTGAAVAPNTPVTFGVDVSNGTDPKTSDAIPIVDPGGVTVSSVDFGLSNVPLTFIGAKNIGTSALADAQYTTNFTIPAGVATGLHSLTATVKDTSGQTTSTTFDTVVVAPADVAFYTGVTIGPDPKNAGKTTTTAIGPGDTAELDDATTGVKAASVGVRDQATADANGTIILFVAPGMYTFKVTSADGKTVTTQQDASGNPAVLDLTKAAGTAVVQ